MAGGWWTIIYNSNARSCHATGVRYLQIQIILIAQATKHRLGQTGKCTCGYCLWIESKGSGK